MNRTDRLLAIVLELQAKGWQRAEDLAARFEISKRTVYRDMQALSESGVPVISMPGQGYSLVEGYFLPPLTFSADEALILLLGGDFMARNFDAEYRRAAQTAVSKIEAVLTDELREEVRYLQRSLRFRRRDASRRLLRCFNKSAAPSSSGAYRALRLSCAQAAKTSAEQNATAMPTRMRWSTPTDTGT